MKAKLLIFAILLRFSAYSQDTIWISKTGTVVSQKDSAQQFNVVFRNYTDTQQVRVLSFSLDGVILREANYSPYIPRPVLNGISKKYNYGQLVEEIMYANNQLNGYHHTFWENSCPKRKDWYENGTFIRGNCYGFNGADTTWFPYEVYASFPGGADSLRRFIAKNLKYPSNAIRDATGGTVKVKFVISKDGSVADIQVMNHVNPLLEQEAVRLVNVMPKWNPAQMDGRLVNMNFILPVAFRLNE